MKAITPCLAIAIFLCSSAMGQPAWQLHDVPVNEDFISVSFVDENNGWIISTAGTIISTNSGGDSWTSVSYPQYHFESVHFSSLDHGCIVGWHNEPQDSSLILVTTNGGSTWSEPLYPKVTRLNDVYFASSSVGWAVGVKGDYNMNCCLHTADGGENWNAAMDIFVAGAELQGVHFRDLLTGVVCGHDGAFFHTNSGGTSGWALNISMPLTNLNAVCNMGSVYGCAVGNDGLALYTINDWYQHIDMVTGTQESLNAVSADPASNTLWAAGANGTIIHCQSYLLGWSHQNSGTTENLNDIQMLSGTNGWAVGNNGTVLHYTESTSVPQAGEIRMTVTPNPAQGKFVLNFGQKRMIDRIELIDVFGRVCKIFIPEEMREKITIDATEKEDGIYFLKVSSAQQSYTKRIVIHH